MTFRMWDESLVPLREPEMGDVVRVTVGQFAGGLGAVTSLGSYGSEHAKTVRVWMWDSKIEIEIMTFALTIVMAA